MKKILIFAVVLLIVSASVFGSGQNEGKYSVDDFQGTWQQINGSSVITITGNDFTILNMEIGYAGYGSVSLVTSNENNVKKEKIQFDLNSSGKGKFSKGGNYFYLGYSEELINNINNQKDWFFKGKIFINDFQIKAWKEFSPISEKNGKYPDDIIAKYFNLPLYEKKAAGPSVGSGGGIYYFDLNGDNLKIIETDEKFVYSHDFAHLIHLLLTGEFERVN